MQCRALLEEMAPGRCEFAPSPHGAGLQEADFYIWDFRPEYFPHGLRPEIIARSLFLVDPAMLDGFQRAAGRLAGERDLETCAIIRAPPVSRAYSRVEKRWSSTI